MVKILFFGKLSEQIGEREIVVDLPADIALSTDLVAWLEKRFDATNTLGTDSVKIMINQSFIHGPTPIKNADEIGFLPPVGGG